MIITEKTMVEIERDAKIVCDDCKKEFAFGGESSDMMEVQEFTRIKFTGGYLSIFGDMHSVEVDLCQHCLKKRLGDILRITPG